MADQSAIVVGLPVFGLDNQPPGVIESVDDTIVTVGGRTIPRAAVGQVRDGAVYLRVAAAALMARPDTPVVAEAKTAAAPAEQLGVPIVEEHLTVGTREVALGEIEIRKRVVEETCCRR
jgi:hypothetical protein